MPEEKVKDIARLSDKSFHDFAAACQKDLCVAESLQQFKCTKRSELLV